MHNDNPSKYKVADSDKKKQKEYQEKREEEEKKQKEKEEKEKEKKQKAYDKWLKERENHKHWVVDQKEVKEKVKVIDQEAQEAWDEDTGEVDDDGNPIIIHHDAVPEQSHYEEKVVQEEKGHWEYDKGYRDGDFKYP